MLLVFNILCKLLTLEVLMAAQLALLERSWQDLKAGFYLLVLIEFLYFCTSLSLSGLATSSQGPVGLDLSHFQKQRELSYFSP